MLRGEDSLEKNLQYLIFANGGGKQSELEPRYFLLRKKNHLAMGDIHLALMYLFNFFFS